MLEIGYPVITSYQYNWSINRLALLENDFLILIHVLHGFSLDKNALTPLSCQS